MLHTLPEQFLFRSRPTGSTLSDVLALVSSLLPESAVGLLPRRAGSRQPSPTHVHRYRRTGDDPFSGASLYACRCGVARAAM